MKLSLRQRQMISGYFLISPWLIGTAVLFAWALGRSLLLSFQKVTSLANLQTEWAGLANYIRVFLEDVRFIPALVVTVRDLATTLPLILVFSLSLALLLAQLKRGQMLVRAVFFLPVVIGSAAVVQQLLNAGAGEMVMSSTLQPLLATASTSGSQYGSVLSPVTWVVDRMTLIIWHTGVQILLFVAGLNSIPPTLYEAAYVDGSTGWEALYKITLPMLSPIILVAAIYTAVDTFTNPLNQVVQHINQASIGIKLQLEYGAAMGWLYFLTTFLLLLLLLAASSRMVFYAGERQ